ncbi:MAG: KamA family radical SAM protein [Pirellulaceae bacterium]
MKGHKGQILAANASSVEATLNRGIASLPQPSTTKPLQPVSWQQAMKAAIRSGRELCEHLGLPPELACKSSESDFPVFAPLEYVSRMQFGDAHDPLLIQVLGQSLEMQFDPAGSRDPVGDLAARRTGDQTEFAENFDPVLNSTEVQPGLLQKYRRRVLMITAGACAVHCRYCFRRHFPYETVPKGKVGWQAALDAIAHDHSIDEVILSGGDPLTVTDGLLSWLVERLNAIHHIQRIRVHTRVPVVIPQRVTPGLLKIVSRSRAAMVFVLHFNHSHEIDEHVRGALRALRLAGSTLLNQAVCLRDVNDSLEQQRALCLTLVNAQVIPYYLHQLDLVQGATHFAVDDARVIDIVEGLRRELPGYAVPKLVREIAGQPSKTPVA